QPRLHPHAQQGHRPPVRNGRRGHARVHLLTGWPGDQLREAGSGPRAGAGAAPVCPALASAPPGLTYSRMISIIILCPQHTEAAMPDATRLAPVTPIEERGYARPEALVSTEWVAERLEDPGVRLIESDEDLLLYETGHIPGAVKLDWVSDLNDPVLRDYVDHERLQAILRARGVNRDTTIVLYGDKNNWWATYTFWVLRLFGLENLRIMDGGRARWEEEGRPLTTEVPQYPEGDIVVAPR